MKKFNYDIDEVFGSRKYFNRSAAIQKAARSKNKLWGITEIKLMNGDVVWSVYYRSFGKRYYLGRFNTLREALNARDGMYSEGVSKKRRKRWVIDANTRTANSLRARRENFDIANTGKNGVDQFFVQIRLNGKQYCLGYYSTVEEARVIRDRFLNDPAEYELILKEISKRRGEMYLKRNPHYGIHKYKNDRTFKVILRRRGEKHRKLGIKSLEEAIVIRDQMLEELG